ncbi:MAG: alkaline phosphatase D family protein [Chitinophagales bacterium]
MKKLFTVICITAFLFGCNKDTNKLPTVEGNLTKIAFGSCSYQYSEGKVIFDKILKQKPQLYIAGGDNVYADIVALAPGDSAYIEKSYKDLFYGSPEWVKLRQEVPMIATWDDHDTGLNDGVSDNPVKAYGKASFFKWWQIAETDERHNRPDGGIYGSYYYGDDAHKVQVIMLDLRWNHTPYKTAGPGAALSGYDTLMSPSATILGETQWTWLEGELRKPAKVRIVMSSLQFNSLYSGGENWAVLPLEKQKMYDLIKSTQANGVFFLSGDVHYAEFTKTQPAGMYPIYDFTSSGITHYEGSVPSTNNAIRAGQAYRGRNYGIINIDWNATPVAIKVEIFGQYDDVPRISRTVTLDELKF